MNNIIQSNGLAYSQAGQYQPADMSALNYQQGQVADLSQMQPDQPADMSGVLDAAQVMKARNEEKRGQKLAAKVQEGKSMTPSLKPNSGFDGAKQSPALNGIMSGNTAGMAMNQPVMTALKPTVAGQAGQAAQSAGTWSKLSGIVSKL